MSPYQRCPYCDVVLDIDTDEKRALRRHIRLEHTDDERAEKRRRAV